jgi:hypothetical protein
VSLDSEREDEQSFEIKESYPESFSEKEKIKLYLENVRTFGGILANIFRN